MMHKSGAIEYTIQLNVSVNNHITQQSKFIHPTSTNCLIVIKKRYLF